MWEIIKSYTLKQIATGSAFVVLLFVSLFVLWGVTP